MSIGIKYQERDEIERNIPLVKYTHENSRGYRLYVTSSYITITVPNKQIPGTTFHFDTKEDWEDFCEATWQTENYIPMKRRDFIEFFEALQFLHSYSQNQLAMSRKKQEAIQQEIDKASQHLTRLQGVIHHYLEVYNESKV